MAVTRKTLLDKITGLPAVAQQGESFDIVATFKDVAPTPATLTEANISTVTLTLFDDLTEKFINSRNAQSVKDANGGILATDGTLTIQLQPADNAIVDGTIAVKSTEKHVARITWQWIDEDADGNDVTRTGIEEYELLVEVKATPTAP